ncbi:ABC transporter ATP-binding protein [Amnibacterium sp.]|uniref:ABC transporter ATP-binding protein n=1 Tax=Amnibacterium sp. TaxID=1872496 RepID=UPI003F7B74A7
MTGEGLPIHVQGLTHEYAARDERFTALADVSLTVEAGGRLTVVGPSGSGKSTLLTLLAGLQRPTRGSIRIGDVELVGLPQRRLAALRRDALAVVVQDPRRNLLPYGTAVENIRFAQRPGARAARRTDPVELLRSLGLEPLAHRRVDGLSGGERQRVAIAAGLARAPRVLLVDEPTSALDARAAAGVVELLETAVRAVGTTLVTITHDAVVADRLGAVVRLAGGRVVTS